MRVAAVDIGTNTVRLLVADRDGDRLTWVHRLTVITRLGRGVDSQHRLHPGAVAHSMEVLEGYRQIIADGVDGLDAVATSAVRDSTDRESFLDEAGRVLGVRPRLISGEEEAMLSFRGVISGLGGEGPLLVIDPGGGSTEFVMGTGRPEYAVSVDTGSVRLTERRLPDHPASEHDQLAALAEVDGLLSAVHLPARPELVAGVGGTFTSLAAMLLELPEYDAARVHGAVFDSAAFRPIVHTLAGLTVAETAAIPSVDADRAEVLLGGAIVVARSLHHVGAGEVVVSEADILDGIALAIEP
jgi:exopolyphosphatase/guanosine-5'-triphosphate,3'-diphosphate pyrophosphatase